MQVSRWPNYYYYSVIRHYQDGYLNAAGDGYTDRTVLWRVAKICEDIMTGKLLAAPDGIPVELQPATLIASLLRTVIIYYEDTAESDSSVRAKLDRRAASTGFLVGVHQERKLGKKKILNTTRLLELECRDSIRLLGLIAAMNRNMQREIKLF